MAKYRGPVCRLCRREAVPLFLKGQRCYTVKCPFLAPKKDIRMQVPLPPGKQPRFRRRRSEYGVQLREKQKARRIYGLMETQFKNYFRRADAARGVTGENLLMRLEVRLDNVVYRLGFATSRRQARELVLHRHFSVNGRKVNIPSYQVGEGDTIEVRDRAKNHPFFQDIQTVTSSRPVPAWLEVDRDSGLGRVLVLPAREHITEPINEQLIVNFYSR